MLLYQRIYRGSSNTWIKPKRLVFFEPPERDVKPKTPHEPEPDKDADRKDETADKKSEEDKDKAPEGGEATQIAKQSQQKRMEIGAIGEKRGKMEQIQNEAWAILEKKHGWINDKNEGTAIPDSEIRKKIQKNMVKQEDLLKEFEINDENNKKNLEDAILEVTKFFLGKEGHGGLNLDNDLKYLKEDLLPHFIQALDSIRSMVKSEYGFSKPIEALHGFSEFIKKPGEEGFLSKNGNTYSVNSEGIKKLLLTSQPEKLAHQYKNFITIQFSTDRTTPQPQTTAQTTPSQTVPAATPQVQPSTETTSPSTPEKATVSTTKPTESTNKPTETPLVTPTLTPTNTSTTAENAQNNDQQKQSESEPEPDFGKAIMEAIEKRDIGGLIKVFVTAIMGTTIGKAISGWMNGDKGKQVISSLNKSLEPIMKTIRGVLGMGESIDLNKIISEQGYSEPEKLSIIGTPERSGFIGVCNAHNIHIDDLATIIKDKKAMKQILEEKNKNPNETWETYMKEHLGAPEEKNTLKEKAGKLSAKELADIFTSPKAKK